MLEVSELKWSPLGLVGPVQYLPCNVEFVGTTVTEHELLTHIGRCAGVAYRWAIDDTDDEKAIRRALSCIRKGHHSVLEHVHLTTNSIVDRGTSHALVRHRHIAVTQSSTIYQKFNNCVLCIGRPDKDPITEQDITQLTDEDLNVVSMAALEYIDGVNIGHAASIERDLLPNMLATTVTITTHIGQYVYMVKRRQGPGDAFRMHVWAKMMQELLEKYYPRTMVAFEEYYARRPLQ